MKYRQLGENLSHASSDNYWDQIGCTPRCKFTKYKLKPMVEGTNDENKIMMKKADGANIEVNSKDIQEWNNYKKFERKFHFPVQDLILLSRNRIETENSDLWLHIFVCWYWWVFWTFTGTFLLQLGWYDAWIHGKVFLRDQIKVSMFKNFIL